MLPADSIDKIDPADRNERIDPADAADKIDPAEATDKTDITEAIDRIDAVEKALFTLRYDASERLDFVDSQERSANTSWVMAPQGRSPKRQASTATRRSTVLSTSRSVPQINVALESQVIWS